MDKEYGNAYQTERPQPNAARPMRGTDLGFGGQTAQEFLLSHAERMRAEAHQLETLARELRPDTLSRASSEMLLRLVMNGSIAR